MTIPATATTISPIRRVENPRTPLMLLGDIKEHAERLFDQLDVSENTRKDYKARIGLFLAFAQGVKFHKYSFLHFKRMLGDRSDLSISTKNKYLITAKVLLREMNRAGLIPDITQNVKTFRQDKKHKKEGAK